MFKVHFMLEPFAALNMSVAFQKQVRITSFDGLR